MPHADPTAARHASADDYFDPAEFSIRADIEDAHYWHLHRREVLLDALKAVCPNRAAHLVEVGCGIGTVASHLNANGFNVDYAEVHQAGLDIARKRAMARMGSAFGDQRSFLKLDVLAAPIPRRYNGILMFDVLEHLPDAQLALENLRQGLLREPDAFVLLTVPAFQFLWSPWDEIEKHKCRYTAATLRSVANAAGFDVSRSTYFFSPLFFAALGVKGLRRGRALLSPPKQAESISDLAESKNIAAVNHLALAALKLELSWLRKRDLPFGTSLLAVLKPR